MPSPTLDWQSRKSGGSEFFELAPLPNLTLAFFTRRGGTSRPPFDSLNLSYQVGDCRECVDANYHRVGSALRLPGTFLLYAVGFILLAVFRLSRRRTKRAAKESGDRKEHRIRLLASSDPNFATPCYRCRFWRSEGARCLLRLAGDEVREITIDQRRYCASFEPGREPEELGESPGGAGQ